MHSKCTEKAEKMLHHHLPLINHLPKMILGRKEIDKDTDKGDRGGLLQEEQPQEKKFLRFTWLSSLIAGLFVDTQLSTRKARVNARKKTSHFPWTNNQGTRIRDDLQAMPHVTHGHDDGHCPEIGGQRWRCYCWKTLWTGCQANLRLQAIPCNMFRWWTFSMCQKNCNVRHHRPLLSPWSGHAKAKGGRPRAHKFRKMMSYRISSEWCWCLFYGGDEIWLISFTSYISSRFYLQTVDDPEMRDRWWTTDLSLVVQLIFWLQPRPSPRRSLLITVQQQKKKAGED